jgi:hypothetical protein
MLIHFNIGQLFEYTISKFAPKIKSVDWDKITGIIIFGSYQQNLVPKAVQALNANGFKVIYQSPVVLNYLYSKTQPRNTILVFEK